MTRFNKHQGGTGEYRLEAWQQKAGGATFYQQGAKLDW